MIQTCAPLGYFLKRAIQDVCRSCTWGLILAKSEGMGGAGWGPTFQGFVVVFFPPEKKKRSLVLTGPQDISVNAVSPSRFFFHVSGVLWIIVRSGTFIRFMDVKGPKRTPPDPHPSLQLSLHNWTLCGYCADTQRLWLWQVCDNYRSFTLNIRKEVCWAMG